MSDFLKAYSNYGLIARVLTNWYVAVGRHPLTAELPHEQKYFTIGLLYCLQYISQGRMVKDDIEYAVRSAFSAEAGTSEEERLLAFVIAMEDRVLSATSSKDYETIKYNVRSNTGVIKDVINSRLKKAAKKPPRVLPVIYRIFENPDLSGIITSFTL